MTMNIKKMQLNYQKAFIMQEAQKAADVILQIICNSRQVDI